MFHPCLWPKASIILFLLTIDYQHKHRHSDYIAMKMQSSLLPTGQSVSKMQFIVYSTSSRQGFPIIIQTLQIKWKHAYCHIIESLTFVFMRLLLNTELFPLSKFILLKCSPPSEVGRSPQPSLWLLRLQKQLDWENKLGLMRITPTKLTFLILIDLIKPLGRVNLIPPCSFLFIDCMVFSLWIRAE